MSTVCVDLLIDNKKGLHARPAAKLVRLAASFPNTTVHITRVVRASGTEEVRVIATSVLGLLMLAAEKGCKVTFEASGESACDALAAIADLVEAKFEEIE